jgi:hypothetical protein
MRFSFGVFIISAISSTYVFAQIPCNVECKDLITPPLIPCPEKVHGVEQVKVDLTGKWFFSSNFQQNFLKQQEPSAEWSQIDVPGEWVMQGFAVEPNCAAGYWRKFQVPADWNNKTVILRCDGIYSDSKIWINGQEAGSHVGGFTAFNLDVSRMIRSGTENTIAISVRSESPADTASKASLYAGHQLGGITRKIYLFAAPQVMVTNFHVVTRADKKYQDWTVAIDLDVLNSNKTAAGITAAFEIEGPGGKLKIDQNRMKFSSTANLTVLSQAIEIPVITPKQWNPEHPNLYTVYCIIRQDGNEIETLKRRIGFRQIEVRANELLVNGKPVKLRGICRHEADPRYGRCTREFWQSDAELFRSANINFIRTPHYPPAEEFLDACDELGIFVEDEAPVCWVKDQQLRSTILQQSTAMVQRDKIHPCVIIWSLANESRWNQMFEDSKIAIKRIDISRPVIFSYGQVDIASRHYPVPADIDNIANARIPYLFDEYCHTNCYNHGELLADPGLRDKWAQGFEAMWEKIYDAKAALGGAIWAGADDVFYIPGSKTVSTRCSEWGIIDGWRREKPEYWHVKKVYSPVKIRTEQYDEPNQGEPLRINVENRYDFTNLSEVGINWIRDANQGTIKADIEPRSKGIIEIPWSGGPGILSLQFTDPRGFAADEYRLKVGQVESRAEHFILRKPVLDQNESAYRIKQANRCWEVDKKTGMIRFGKLDDAIIVLGGPVFSISYCTGYDTNRGTGPGEPCSPILNGWVMDRMDVNEIDEGIAIKVRGCCRNLKGSYTLLFTKDTRLNINYAFETTGGRPREIGMAFDIARHFDTLSWKRNGQWSIYPAGHIGRQIGKTVAMGNYGKVDPNVRPSTWSQDQTAMGTNDFRSSKYNVVWAALGDANNAGLVVKGSGRQAVRCFVDGNSIKMLINSYSNAGGDKFVAKHINTQAFAAGTIACDEFYLRLTPNIPNLFEPRSDDTRRKNTPAE